MKRLLSAFISLCMLIQPVSSFAEIRTIPEGFTDIENHWAEETIVRHQRDGMAKGYLDNTFKPDKKMKRSEMATFINRYFGFSEETEDNFEDVNSDDWYFSETAKAKYYEYIEGLEMRPEESASRLDVVEALSLILDLSEQRQSEKTIRFSDMEGLIAEDRENIESFTKLGYIKGYEDGTFRPREAVSRAEILSIMERVLGYIVITQEDADAIPDGTEKITVIGRNIIFENLEIEGSVYITAGVRGSVEFRNADIKGTLEIAGGEVFLVDSAAKRIVTAKAKEAPKIVISGGRVETLETKSGAQIVMKDAAKAGTIESNGETGLDIGEGSEVGRLEANSKTTVAGRGKIERTYLHSGELEMEEKKGYLRVYGAGLAMVAGRKITRSNDDYKPSDGNSTTSLPPSAGEDGSSERPFLIDSIEDLARIGTTDEWSLDKRYKLMKDLDFTSDSSYESGAVNPDYIEGPETDGWEPVGSFDNPFNGTFDGNKKTIGSLYISYANDFNGLFGFVSGGSIINTWLENVHVDGTMYSGGLVGGAENTTITGSFVEGRINGTFSAGGLAGGMESCEVSDSHAFCDVFSGFASGGLFGFGQNCTIRNSYSRGRTGSGEVAGGIAGMFYEGSVLSCVAFNELVIGDEKSFRVVGLVEDDCLLDNYANRAMIVNGLTTSSADSTTLSGADLDSMVATEELPLSRWDFKNVWEIKEGESFPTFREGAGEDSVPPEIGNCAASPGNEVGEILLDAEMDENGSVYYVAATSGSTAPSADDIKVGQGFVASGNAPYFDYFTITDLVQNAFYDIYIVAEDVDGLFSEVKALPGIKASAINYGSGTTGDPFKIYTIEDLARVGSGNMDQNANAWDSWDSYELMNDLDFTSASSYGSGEVNPGYTAGTTTGGWVPIGTETFDGLFDGGGYSISHLLIDRPGSLYQGLFRCISGAEIKDVSLENASVEGNASSGVLVGYAYNDSYITGCSSSGTVSGAGQTGGLVGTLDGSAIFGSWSSVNVQASGGYSGGLVGYATNMCGSINNVISDSYATGDVAAESFAGGLVGNVDSGSTISNCYATGKVIVTSSHAGGLVGAIHLSMVVSCAAMGETVTESSSAGRVIGYYSSGTISGNYANENMLVNGSVQSSADGASMYGAGISDVTSTGALPLSGWDFTGVWQMENGASRPTLRGIGNDDPVPPSFTTMSAIAGEEAISLTASINESGTIYYAVVTSGSAALTKEQIKHGSGYAATGSAASFDSFSVSGLIVGDSYDIYAVATDEAGNSTAVSAINGIKPKAIVSGTGTDSDPFQIQTIDDLATIGSKDGWFLDKSYKLMNDLDFASAESYENNSEYLSNETFTTGTGWVPIGDLDSGFEGSFDGNGYSISNLFIDMDSKNYHGLFGYADGATFEDIDLLNVDIESNLDYVGGIVGYAADCEINDCSVSGSVAGDWQIGGLAGFVENTTLSACSAAGDVTGDTYVGGLVGRAISSAFVDGSVGEVVSGDYYVGGFVGNVQGGTIEGSHSTGSVLGTQYVGGFTGFVGDLTGVTSAYSTEITGSSSSGNVTGGGLINGGTGGFAGGIGDHTSSIYGKTFIVEDCYAAGSVSGTLNVGGFVGKSYGEDVDIGKSYATGNISGKSRVGGFGGYLSTATISGCYATGSVSDPSVDEDTGKHGGFVGFADSSNIYYSYAAGSVTGYWSVGGFIGYMDDSIDSSVIHGSYAMGNVSGAKRVGGFAGFVMKGKFTYDNFNTMEIEKCYSTGTVIGSDYAAGGFAGEVFCADFIDCYSAGKFVAGDDGTGGFAARLTGSSSNCPGESKLSDCIAFVGSVTGNNNIFRLVGYEYGDVTISDNYAYEGMEVNGTALTETNAQSMAGADLADMISQDSRPLSNWDFDETDSDGDYSYWKIEAGMERPVLYVDLDRDGTFEKLGSDDGMLGF